MKKIVLSLFALSLLCSCGGESKGSAEKLYEANWESLREHTRAPEWFKDAKLGIYFHWGLYTVPAYGNAWYPRFMYDSEGELEEFGRKIYKHHVDTYGKDFDYHEFADMMTAEHFDPEDWAQLFADAGAQFGGPVAMHHDGFAMWDSELAPYSIGTKGAKRDIMGELFKSLEKRGMHTIATFHHARLGQRYAKDTANWGGVNSHYPYRPDLVTSTTDPELKYFYGNLEEDEFNKYWLGLVDEVVDNYSPDIIWFDSWLDEIPESYRQQMVADQFNAGVEDGKENIVAYKQQDLPADIAVLDVEQGGLKEMGDNYWMTDITLSTGSWGYVEGQGYKTLDVLVRNMIDVWSKKGIVLLNISPRADGVINDEQRELLHGLGRWTKANGEAIYGTRAYSIFGYGDAAIEAGHFGGQSATMQYTASDVRFTRAADGSAIYAFVLGMPEGEAALKLHDIEGEVAGVSLLASGEELKWERGADNKLTVTTPATDKMDTVANVFKISLKK